MISDSGWVRVMSKPPPMTTMLAQNTLRRPSLSASAPTWAEL